MNVPLVNEAPLSGQAGGLWLVKALKTAFASITTAFHVEHNADNSHGTIHASGPIAERGRTFPLGDPQAGPVAPAGFTGSGSQTFAVGSFTTNVFTVVGQELRWHLFWLSCTVGGTHNTELRAQLPLSATVAYETAGPILVSDNGGTFQTGWYIVRPTLRYVSFYVDATLVTNWTLSSAATIILGQLTIPILAGV